MAYSKEGRAAVIAKMLPPSSVAIPVLSRQEGISEATLYEWHGETRAGRSSRPCCMRPAARPAWGGIDKKVTVFHLPRINPDTVSG